MLTDGIELKERWYRQSLKGDSDQPTRDVGIEHLFTRHPEWVTGVRTILDCGGGTGKRLDTLLDLLPNAEGILIDVAPCMIEANQPHPRKKCFQGNLERLEEKFLEGRKREFDLILFSYVLHHCVANTYEQTRELQRDIINKARELLSPHGRIVVWEVIADSWVTKEYSAKLIFGLTRLSMLSGVLFLCGAKTAGTGVCFMSEGQFQRLCSEAGVCMKGQENSHALCQNEQDMSCKEIIKRAREYLIQLSWRMFLGVRTIRHLVYFLEPK